VKTAICVCTYDRPFGLSLLLKALDALRLPQHYADEHIILVVVDNSEHGTARKTVNSFLETGRFGVTYVQEKKKGLSFARNAALDAARQADASLLAFIDDDEVPHPDWLRHLLTALEVSGAAAAIGPVCPIFTAMPFGRVPVGAYATRRSQTGGMVEDGYTCNVVMRLSAIDDNAIRFDEAFNETGGEDTLFFQKWRQRGLKIAWAENAVVYEFVPAARITSRWLLRRWYRTGNTESHLGAYPPDGAKGMLHNLARGSARVAAGGGRVAWAALRHAGRRPENVVASCYTLCRGAGLIAAVFGRRYDEYSRTRYR
jgi:glycosyltransferase involved in cell wall biosynthesis